MTVEEIKALSKEQIEERKLEIKTEIDGADQAKLDELNAELDAIEERAKEIVMDERRDAMKELLAGAGKVVEKQEVVTKTVEVRDSKEYIDAFALYLQTGDDRECRALLTENVSGTVPVPSFVDDTIRTAWNDSEILSRVRKTNIKGNLRVPFELSASDAYEHVEGTTAPTEESLSLGIVTMIPKNIKKWIHISDEVIAMGGQPLVEYVYRELAKKIVDKLTELVVTDISTLSTSAGSTAVSAAKITDAPGLNTVSSAYANLCDEAKNNVIIMNRLTYANFTAARSAGNFAVDPFMGLPVLFCDTLPAYNSANTNAVYAIVGDLDGAQVNYPEGEGIVLKYDDTSEAEKDLVKIVGRQYAAHAVTACKRFTNIAKPSGSTT